MQAIFINCFNYFINSLNVLSFDSNYKLEIVK